MLKTMPYEQALRRCDDLDMAKRSDMSGHDAMAADFPNVWKRSTDQCEVHGTDTVHWQGPLSDQTVDEVLIHKIKVIATADRDLIAKTHYQARYREKKASYWSDWILNHGKAVCRWVRNDFKPPTHVLIDPDTDQPTGEPSRILQIFRSTWSEFYAHFKRKPGGKPC